MAATPDFSIIVPGYNEEHAIEGTIAQIRAVMQAAGERNYELVVVNDCSTDGTGAVLDKVKQADPSLVVVHHERNRGYGAALKSGIRASRGELVAITDADGTYPNDRLPDLLRLCADADMVVGSRTSDNVTYSRIRMIPKLFLRAYASWISRTNIPDINSGLRVFRRELVEKYLTILPDGFSFTTTITLALLTNNYRVVFEPIDYFERIGHSKIKPVRDTLNFIQLIARTGMYFAPARVLFPVLLAVGFCALISLGYDVLVLDNLTDKSVILVMFTMNTAMFALLADMLDKRT
ncbi:MAG: glycosyltransferase family 2 protein [Gammaproteobacteria bacterium]|nr:glycosyltransferase family 2 protein [Gammaproteobacteria bacterium]